MPLPVDPLRTTAIALLLALAGCAGGEVRPGPVASGMPGEEVARVGPPYQVGGQTFTPADDRSYDVVGIASWYGNEHHGQRTASGEPFDMNAITAAHPTLPIPSYAEVTSLENGTIILVRINDRGPFARGRIIDLSRGAARLLGVENNGNAAVRVRRIIPSDADRAALRAGRPAAARLSATPQLLAGLNARLSGRAAPIMPVARATAGPPATAITSRPPATPPPPAAQSRATPDNHYVQIAAFSDRGRAERLSNTLSDIGKTEIVAAGSFFRVRLGPASPQDAARMLAEARRRGYQDARIIR